MSEINGTIVNLRNTETMENLMRAFAGESQARNRYTFAASFAKEHNMHAIEAVFLFTANQEKEHAEIFYNFLSNLSGETVKIEGTYPIDISDDILDLLKAAQHNEYEEHEPVYREFGDVARKEGFPQIAAAFYNIAKIEKTHGDRFKKLAELIEEKKIFVSEIDCKWMCLNCGYIYEGKEVPETCPVCQHGRGYFIRLKMAPFSCECIC